MSADSVTDRLTARAPWPTSRSRQSRIGRSANGADVACCRAAHIFRACTGSTRVSLSNTVNSVAGYLAAGRTRWYGE